jgi:hypothetical protein
VAAHGSVGRVVTAGAVGRRPTSGCTGRNERYDFWKAEVRPHLANSEEPVSLDDFPNNYCFFASEWKSYDGEVIVLLSKAH